MGGGLAVGNNGRGARRQATTQILQMNSISYKYDYVFELLEDLCTDPPSTQTNLIVCSSKEDFLGQIIPALDGHDDESRPTTPRSGEGHSQPDPASPPRLSRDFLSPILHLLSTSQSVNLIFCPTIPTLRGYLSGYVSLPGPASCESRPSSLHASQVIVLNLLALHHGSSEFNLQGLSRSFATAVAAAHRTSRHLTLAECRDISDPSSPIRGSGLWQAEVPLLSGSIKIGEGGASWGRRTISVLKVASRWFSVQEGERGGGGASSRDRLAGAERELPS